MSERQYYHIQLNLNNTFLKWIYSHRLVDGDTAAIFWRNKPEPYITAFGGLNGIPFTTKSEMWSFDEAFDQLLVRYNIEESYRCSLMYFMIFLNTGYEEQSLNNNKYNRLIEYAQFILNLYVNSKRHFEAMEKNSAYQMIFDEATQEYLFAKKSLYEQMPLDELVEFVPDKKHADDIIRYMRITIGESELYIPPGMHLSVISHQALKNLSGEEITNIALPPYLQYEVFSYTINLMVQAHKKENTTFYQYLSTEEVTPKELLKVYNQYKKHQVSQSQSLLKVAIMISDYLKEQKLITIKRKAAEFIFEYFSLFKAFSLKSNQTPPNDYEELPRFYTRNGINKETVRMMLKDVGEI